MHACSRSRSWRSSSILRRVGTRWVEVSTIFNWSTLPRLLHILKLPITNPPHLRHWCYCCCTQANERTNHLPTSIMTYYGDQWKTPMLNARSHRSRKGLLQAPPQARARRNGERWITVRRNIQLREADNKPGWCSWAFESCADTPTWAACIYCRRSVSYFPMLHSMSRFEFGGYVWTDQPWCYSNDSIWLATW